MGRKRRVGSIAYFEAVRRKQQKAAAPVPAHLASGRPTAMMRRAGEWLVFSAPVVGPPFERSRQIAGPFDTREEADEWIDENHDA